MFWAYCRSVALFWQATLTFWRKKKTVTLGYEYDEALLKRLMAVLAAEGATFITEWSAVGGSQDISNWCFRLKGQTLIVEAETYIGLSLIGPAALVTQLSVAVAEQPAA